MDVTQARWINRCHIGDCRDTLRRMAADGVRVQMCVTSPPYWGLRDYGTATWAGGDDGCDHQVPRHTDRERKFPVGTGFSTWTTREETAKAGDCRKCGASRIDAQLGLEATPEEYIANMVEVFRLVREVLADDAICWINMGDNFVDKQLQGMPWRLAFALQADDWYLRSDIIWHKANPMPESVTDRPAKSHEYVFLLSKQADYYYDANAVREPQSLLSSGKLAAGSGSRTSLKSESAESKGSQASQWRSGASRDVGGRNLRTVWTIATQPYSEAHFATFPQKLVEPCIMAGTSERGHCPECGKRWERVVKSEFQSEHRRDPLKGSGTKGMDESNTWAAFPRGITRTSTTGWQPTCTHNLDPVPDVVLDPFFGSGTVGQVAENLGRSWIGLELNPEYVKMSEKRTAQMGMAL